jgi:hypothetical protein
VNDQRIETLELLASLSEEQVQQVLTYARSLRDGFAVLKAEGLEELLEELA